VVFWPNNKILNKKLGCKEFPLLLYPSSHYLNGETPNLEPISPGACFLAQEKLALIIIKARKEGYV
jgi:hypothetical protein